MTYVCKIHETRRAAETMNFYFRLDEFYAGKKGSVRTSARILWYGNDDDIEPKVLRRIGIRFENFSKR